MLTLKDVEVRPGEALEWASPIWSKEDIRRGILYALWEMTTYGYYAPYVERFPIALDEEIPQAAREAMLEHDSFACTEGSKVYFDTERAAKAFEAMMKEKGSSSDLAQEVKAVLAHEYTHILCEHRAIGEALARKYGKRAPRGVCVCHTIACEIQANRGSGVRTDSLIYKSGVTEEKFPETKGLYTYSEIFAALLKNYNKKQKEMEELVKMIKDLFGDDLAKMIQEGEGEGEGKEGKEKEGEKEGGGNPLSQLLDGIKGKKTKDVEEHELTEEEIKKAIDKANNSEQEVYEEIQEFGGGYGLDKVDDDKLELNPDKTLETEFKRWDEQRIKNELKRMKGYIRGSFSREREKTYARPTRRSIDPSSKLIRKGIRNGKSLMPRVLVAMDSSGSMGGTPVTTVATAIGNLFKDLGRPTEGCYIVKHESRCSEPKPLSQWEDVVKSFRPSGGNCFNNVVKLANELNVDVVFNIGDGCDCCVRSYEDDADRVCKEFKEAGRKWVDTLIFDKKNNGYYDGEYNFDKERGFEREILQLGSSIGKYL